MMDRENAYERVDEAPTHLDLFSGIGGFAIACRWAGFRTVAFCEIDGWCRKVLAKNFNVYTDRERQSGVPFNDEMALMFGDIRKVWGTQFRGVDLITGGFPCQPFSVAGKRGGAGDDRAIWPEMFRVISEARPAWVLGENVSGIVAMELDNVLSDLEGIGYATRAFIVPACAVDARHRRDRVWIIGRRIHPDTKHDGLPAAEPGLGTQRAKERADELQQSAGQDSVCDTAEQGLPDGGSAQVGDAGGTFAEPERPDSGDWCWWESEPDVGRVAHGVSRRVDRLKGLGNAIVPQVAYEILKVIHEETMWKRK